MESEVTNESMLYFSSFNTRWLRKFDIKGKKCWFLSEPKFVSIY